MASTILTHIFCLHLFIGSVAIQIRSRQPYQPDNLEKLRLQGSAAYISADDGVQSGGTRRRCVGGNTYRWRHDLCWCLSDGESRSWMRRALSAQRWYYNRYTFVCNARRDILPSQSLPVIHTWLHQKAPMEGPRSVKAPTASSCSPLTVISRSMGRKSPSGWILSFSQLTGRPMGLPTRRTFSDSRAAHFLNNSALTKVGSNLRQILVIPKCGKQPFYIFTLKLGQRSTSANNVSYAIW